jgi:hypothetical protein
MHIYPPNTEQWRINLIENPPPSSKLYEPEEWRDIVLNELHKHTPMSESMRKAIGETVREVWKDPEYKARVGKKISESQIGRVNSEESNEKRRKSMIGKRHSEASKQLMRLKAGHKHTDETKEKLSIAAKGRPLTDLHKENIRNIARGRMHITNGIDNRFIPGTEEIPIGWKRGRTMK